MLGGELESGVREARVKARDWSGLTLCSSELENGVREALLAVHALLPSVRPDVDEWGKIFIFCSSFSLIIAKD